MARRRNRRRGDDEDDYIEPSPKNSSMPTWAQIVIGLVVGAVGMYTSVRTDIAQMQTTIAGRTPIISKVEDLGSRMTIHEAQLGILSAKQVEAEKYANRFEQLIRDNTKVLGQVVLSNSLIAAERDHIERRLTKIEEQLND